MVKRGLKNLIICVTNLCIIFHMNEHCKIQSKIYRIVKVLSKKAELVNSNNAEITKKMTSYISSVEKSPRRGTLNKSLLVLLNLSLCTYRIIFAKNYS